MSRPGQSGSSWTANGYVAIGGLRALGDGICEIKRMYVAPDARSRGIGRALLDALEGAGSRIGYTKVRLDL